MKADSAPWLELFVSEVASHMRSFDGTLPVQCHVFHNRGEANEWEITVFGEPQAFGGRLAEFRIDPGFTVDVFGLITLFDSLESCGWQTAPVDQTDELGSHFSVTGTYAGRKVWLRLLSRAPERLCQASSRAHLR